MIITVTLNAAIDKTLAVPNFRLGRRHRAVEQTSMAGGKGVNVARALKALGQPVIATGIAGRAHRHAHHRAAHRRAHPQRLRAHPRGVAHVHRRGGPHLGRADRDQRARPQRVGGRARAVRGQAALPGPGRGAVHLLRQRARAGSTRALYARLVPELRRLGVTSIVDAEGEAMRLATRAGPDVVTPNELEAEELVGHEFADADDRATAVKEIVEIGAREAIMTMPDGCLALLGTDSDATRPRQLCRATLDPLEPVSSVGSGDAFLAGWVAARYDDRPAQECLRFAVACGAESTQHFGAGVLDPREVNRLLSEVELEVLDGQALSLGR
ncbi:MAG: PfkB family carbohydrate kinase [Thermoleophilaceae bacterium]